MLRWTSPAPGTSAGWTKEQDREQNVDYCGDSDCELTRQVTQAKRTENEGNDNSKLGVDVPEVGEDEVG
ncbi:hypothetical protein ON010_g14598 [Phytophthora cinnamomi]|nr:hypothetical protein ON010_g14598 [Phytophthora cinnamomi]